MHLYSTARKTPCDSSCANSTKTGQKVLLSFLACFRPSLPCCKSKEKKTPRGTYLPRRVLRHRHRRRPNVSQYRFSGSGGSDAGVMPGGGGVRYHGAGPVPFAASLCQRPTTKAFSFLLRCDGAREGGGGNSGGFCNWKHGGKGERGMVVVVVQC